MGLDAAALDVGVDLLLVERTTSRELRTAIRDPDLGVAFIRQLDSRFQRRVASAYNQHALARVLPGIDEPVGDLFEFLTRNPHLAWRSTAADGQHDPLGGEDSLVGGDQKAVAGSVDSGQLGPLVDLDAGLRNHVLERANQILLSNQ